MTPSSGGGGTPSLSGGALLPSDLEWLSGLAQQCLEADGTEAAAELYELASELLRAGCWSPAVAMELEGEWTQAAFQDRDFAAAAELVHDDRGPGWQALEKLLLETGAALSGAVESRSPDLLTLEHAAAGTHIGRVVPNGARPLMAFRWQDWVMRYCFEGRPLREGVMALDFAAEALAGRHGEEEDQQRSSLIRISRALQSLDAVTGSLPSISLDAFLANREELEAVGWTVVGEGAVDDEDLRTHRERSGGMPLVLLGEAGLLLEPGSDLTVTDDSQVWLARGSSARIRRGGRLLVDGDLQVFGPGREPVEFHSGQDWGGIVLRGRSHSVTDLSVKGATVGFGLLDTRYRWTCLARCSISDCGSGIAGMPLAQAPDDQLTHADGWLWIESVAIRDCDLVGLSVAGFCGLVRSTIDDCGIGAYMTHWSEVAIASCEIEGAVRPLVNLASDGLERLVITNSAITPARGRDPRLEYAHPKSVVLVGNYWGARFKPAHAAYGGDPLAEQASAPPPSDSGALTSRPKGIGVAR